MDVGCGIMDLNSSKRLGHGPADYVKRKEIHRRAAERCAMVLKNRGGLEGGQVGAARSCPRVPVFFVFCVFFNSGFGAILEVLGPRNGHLNQQKR